MNTTLQGNFLFLFLNNSMLNETSDINQGQDVSGMAKKMKIAQVVVLIIAFLGIFENSISILALKKSKELRNPTTTFIINLCVADLLYCVSNLITYLNHEWNKNYYICRWNTMAKYFFAGESVYLIVGITINRFICVVHPQVYRSIYRPISLTFQIVFTWFYALFLASLPFFEVWGKYGYDVNVGLCTILKVNGKSASSFLFITAFVIPTTVFTVCYPLIFRVTHKAYKRARRSNRLRTTATLNTTSAEENSRGKKTSYRADAKEMKILKVMLVVVVAYILCFFPIAFVKISGKDAQMPTFVLFAYFAVNVSNVINPIIYILMSAEYRKAYLELFKCRNNFLVWSTSSNAELIRT
ncbi:G-protein coupled receptor moody-like [Parasteatoda tepidariorum]|uniref:G-protein coupled receptor moody-like n=1 Tax=Parasteatoda tepidariorum TaxID=114398 RepID=UPI001C71DD0A|nr:G-protein coupled receptor moody-like isoform X1 [Parasteatoda tepidariorum]